jgi:pimeloyl-ACP methyl ester carboxylesterase
MLDPQDFEPSYIQLAGTGRLVPDLRIHYIPNCSHWVQQERPGEVNAVMLDVLNSLAS